MWHYPEREVAEFCNECCSRLCISWNRNLMHISCKKCDEVYMELKCTNVNCNFRSKCCPKCLTAEETPKKIKPQPKEDSKENNFCFILTTLVIISAVIGLIVIKSSWTANSEHYLSVTVLERLKEKFPSQKNKTLYHMLSVLEQEMPTVKSITLLHENDMETSHCLAKEMVNIFNENVRMEEVSFDINGIKYNDYGEVLEYYHNVVKRFRVLVTNLSEVPANIAKVFHSLCDEVSSDVKPSLFIFILRQKKETNSRPLEKATAILKEAWRELPDSDLFPLLSRVVKNVVDVIPEKNAVC